jgi:hypothetical protein
MKNASSWKLEAFRSSGYAICYGGFDLIRILKRIYSTMSRTHKNNS